MKQLQVNYPNELTLLRLIEFLKTIPEEDLAKPIIISGSVLDFSHVRWVGIIDEAQRSRIANRDSLLGPAKPFKHLPAGTVVFATETFFADTKWEAPETIITGAMVLKTLESLPNLDSGVWIAQSTYAQDQIESIRQSYPPRNYTETTIDDPDWSDQFWRKFNKPVETGQLIFYIDVGCP